MRPSRFAFLLVFALFPQFALAQQTAIAVQRDPQAIALLQQSVAAMTRSAPADSSATGTITIVEGSTTQSGTIQILTLGTAQTSETLTLPSGTRTVVYSSGSAEETSGGQSAIPPLETAITDQCPDFPLPLLLSALNNSDAAFRYVGAETLNGTPVQHVQYWNSFASKPPFQALASFSLSDMWIDSNSGVPLKLAYVRHLGGGSLPAFPVEVSYSNYKNVGGVLYPFQISKALNGTPWLTIEIQNVSFNTGLTAAQFQVE